MCVDHDSLDPRLMQSLLCMYSFGPASVDSNMLHSFMICSRVSHSLVLFLGALLVPVSEVYEGGGILVMEIICLDIHMNSCFSLRICKLIRDCRNDSVQEQEQLTSCGNELHRLLSSVGGVPAN